MLLPKQFLDLWPPAGTDAFRITPAFYIGPLFPLAALACIGATPLLPDVGTPPPPRIALFMLAVVCVVCFEYYQPVRQFVLNESENAFVEWLQDEPGDVRLIHLPMRHQTRFRSSLYQTFHGFPVAEGLIARRAADSYDYIYNNHLLASWFNLQVSSCFYLYREEHLPALNQLLADGFTHVVWHKRLDAHLSFAVSFAGARAAYEDDFVNVYRLEDLLRACEPGRLAESFATFPYADIYLMPAIIHERNGLVMSMHRSQKAPKDFVTYFSHSSLDQKDMVHVSYDRSDELAVQSSHYALVILENITGSYNGIWLINDPQETDISRMPVYSEWLREHYRICERFLDRADATIDLYLKPNIPCEAQEDQSKFDVLYDGGARLHNISYNLDANHVTFYLVWTITPERGYSFSIQFFDRLGEKALQYDNIVFHDVVTVHGIDISSLPDGAYDMKLILYDPETGVTESGAIVKGDQRFERALDIGMVAID